MRRRSEDVTRRLTRRLGSLNPAVAQIALNELAAMRPEEAAKAVRYVLSACQTANARVTRTLYTVVAACGLVAGTVGAVYGQAQGYSAAEIVVYVICAAIAAAAVSFVLLACAMPAIDRARCSLSARSRALERTVVLMPGVRLPLMIDALLAVKTRTALSPEANDALERAISQQLACSEAADLAVLGTVHRDALVSMMRSHSFFLSELDAGYEGTPSRDYSVALIVGILRAYETITDPKALSLVEHGATLGAYAERRGRSTDASRTVADACRALLPDLRARVEAQRRGETLLRPASAEGDALLRPAETGADALLRPAEEEQQQAEQR